MTPGSIYIVSLFLFRNIYASLQPTVLFSKSIASNRTMYFLILSQTTEIQYSKIENMYSNQQSGILTSVSKLIYFSQATLCSKCGTLLGPIIGRSETSKETCRLCGEGYLVSVAIPYIFKFFVTQLACVNINVKINCSQSLALTACNQM